MGASKMGAMTATRGVLLLALASAMSLAAADDDDEHSERQAARIAGTYTFSGTIHCLLSSSGFNEDLTPRSPAPGAPAAIVQTFSGVATGTRTFNRDGTGTVEIRTQTLTGASAFFTAPGGAGVAFGGPAPKPSGAANGSVTTSTFNWEVVDGKVLIGETTASGEFIEGPQVGTRITIAGIPPSVGVLGRDRRLFSLTHDRLQVEVNTTVAPDGTTRVSPRICSRDRLLRRL